MASKIKISESPAQPKAKYIRKSAFLTTGDDSFRFNFNIPPEAVDDGNTESTSKNINSDDNIIDNLDTNKVTSEEKTVINKKDDCENKNFKFTFSSSGFKFNFKVEDS